MGPFDSRGVCSLGPCFEYGIYLVYIGHTKGPDGSRAFESIVSDCQFLEAEPRTWGGCRADVSYAWVAAIIQKPLRLNVV